MRLRRVGGLLVPDPVREAVAASVRDAFPAEAGGFLACERRGDRLYATDHVALANEAEETTRRFVATVDERAPPTPRVFYHSHTTPTAPSGLTRTDRRHVPERYALVVFAPRGEPNSYRLFARGLRPWRELTVEAPAGDRRSERAALPRLS